MFLTLYIVMHYTWVTYDYAWIDWLLLGRWSGWWCLELEKHVSLLCSLNVFCLQNKVDFPSCKVLLLELSITVVTSIWQLCECCEHVLSCHIMFPDQSQTQRNSFVMSLYRRYAYLRYTCIDRSLFRSYKFPLVWVSVWDFWKFWMSVYVEWSDDTSVWLKRGFIPFIQKSP